MRISKNLVARFCIAFAFALAAFPIASAEGKSPLPVETDSPGACSQVSSAPAIVPPGVDPSSISPNADGPTLVAVAFVVRESRRSCVATETASTAESNACWFAWDGLLEPLILRTN